MKTAVLYSDTFYEPSVVFDLRKCYVGHVYSQSLKLGFVDWHSIDTANCEDGILDRALNTL